LPGGKPAVHEEFPATVAQAIKLFLSGEALFAK
jgi:hypothetical protein